MCGCGGNRRTVTKYRVYLNNGTTRDYLTQAEAEQARKDAGATRPVQAVRVNA